MARFSRWLKRDYDGVVTVVAVCVAVVLGVLGIFDPARLGEAVLLVLGLLAYTILRERRRAAIVERESEALRLMNREELRRELEVARRESQAVQLLNGFELRRELEEARRRTDHWTFKGGTGTYLRAVTLPECVKKAVQEKRPFRVQVEIIDPTNEILCNYYASFRHSGPDGTGEPWTPERTRSESYATILAACWYLQRYVIYLRMDVALSATVPTFRYDLSSHCAFVTQEGPSPHLMFKEPSPHYYYYTRELELSFRQARRVPLELAGKIHLSDEPTVLETRSVFQELGLRMPDSMKDDDVASVVRRALHAGNPYP